MRIPAMIVFTTVIMSYVVESLKYETFIKKK
jgi:hypothetical protein